MTRQAATAEVFWLAFSSLPREERRAVLSQLVQDESVRHDLQDLAVFEARRAEPSRTLDAYLKSRKSG